MKNLKDRVPICESLLKRHEIEPFLKGMITGDEKWITYDNTERKQSKKRPELINRKGVLFHHDNARPHISLVTGQKLKELGWEASMHPPYNPDLSPSDYHLFWSLMNSLNCVKLASKETCKNHLVQFFAQKSQKFYSDGIMILPEKWQKAIDQNGT